MTQSDLLEALQKDKLNGRWWSSRVMFMDDLLLEDEHWSTADEARRSESRIRSGARLLQLVADRYEKHPEIAIENINVLDLGRLVDLAKTRGLDLSGILKAPVLAELGQPED